MLSIVILKFFEEIRTPLLNKFFIFITDLGSFEFYILAISFLFFIFNNKTSLKIVFLLFISFSFNTLIKNIFKLPRPQEDFFHPIHTTSIGEEKFGFPSGHAQNSFVFWFSLTKIFKKKSFFIFSILIVSLISISRLYLSLHFFIDVIGGLIIGFFIINFIFNYMDILIDKFYKFRFNSLIPILIFIISFFMKKNSILLSSFSGLLLGTLILKEKDTRNLTIKNIILRELIGLVVLLLLIFFSFYIFDMLKGVIYLILGLWVSFLSKYLFQKIKI
ncbi:MAG: phosphatase PAP2 family protein [Caldisericia bacterium]|jgi:membrane-associated phospholipid phosphatase|nr:phosphatase PAP2 family protein [Caldisericia bacterium]